MSKLSVIIPSRWDYSADEYTKRSFLPQTVADLFKKAAGDVEVIVTLDGYWPVDENNTFLIADNPNLIIIHRAKAMGMRASINAAAAVAHGEYLMKCDDHCMFAEGYDEVLKADCDRDWIVIPSRYSLDAENWAIENNGKPRRDYHYLCYPNPDKPHDSGMHGVEWWSRCKERLNKPEYDIDDTPSFQGSCWFMHKSWFTDFLGGMSEVGYGTFSQEPQEIGMKTWLGGGAVKTNKKTYYCHLHKGKRYGRGYRQNGQEIVNAHNWAAHHWVHNEEPGMVHKFAWFVDEKFPGQPTWPLDWKEKLGYVG